jgi:hypothetical protein
MHAARFRFMMSSCDDVCALLQGDLEAESAEVRAMLSSAGTGAARVVARKLLDTIVREARDWEVELEARKRQAEGPAPQAASAETDTGCHEAAHLCKKPDKPTWR